MVYNLRLSGYLGKGGTYKFLNRYYFWFKIIDLVKCFIGVCYSCKYTKAFNIKY
jgi:hypothetical protein